jgi:hypothetical protein
MSQQAKHTPTPYYADEHRVNDWRIRQDDGKGGFWEIAEMGGLNSKENAAFIVRACNAHEEMLAALEAASRYADFSECREVADMVKAVIAKAKGE